MKNRIFKKREGYTVIELLQAIIFFGIFILLFVVLIHFLIKFW